MVGVVIYDVRVFVRLINVLLVWLGSYVGARQEFRVWMCVCLNTKILKFSVEHNPQVTETQLSPTFGLHLSQNKNVRYTTTNYVSRAMTYLLTVVDPMCLNYSYMRKNITYTDTHTHAPKQYCVYMFAYI